jgi:hypothetical protein
MQFVKQGSGVFHPKVYLFESSKDDWAYLIGSANFTASAFSTNSEACLLVEASDDPTGATRRGVEAALAGYWKLSEPFEPDELASYRSLWKLFHQKRRGMADDFGDKTRGRSLLATDLIKMTWPRYLKTVLNEKRQYIDERIEVLEKARELFDDNKSFRRMSPTERKGIAGIATLESEVPWGWFGSMFGNGTFRSIVNANSSALSRALDAIPPRGEVRKEHYDNFIRTYLTAFPQRRQHGLATATRLLTMKRPDYFVCFDSANRKGICAAFGIALHHHDYERYWNSVIERILLTEWWRSPRPLAKRGSSIWDGRSAFLDTLYYDPKSQ